MPVYIPAEPYPKQANDSIRSSDWNSAINEVTRLSAATQNLNRDTFTGPLTVNGALTVNDVVTVTGSLLSVSETTVVSTNSTGGPWASFGSNAYYRGNKWNLAKTAEAGVCLIMSAQGGASRDFAFCRMEVGATGATDLVKIGKDGLTVSGALTASGAVTANAALTVKGALRAEGSGTSLAVTGNQTVGGTLTVTGAVTADAALTVKGALRAEGSGTSLTVTGNQTVGGTLTVTGAVTANAALTVKGALRAEGSGTSLTVTGNQTVSGTLTVTGALAANGGITGPSDKLTINTSYVSVEALAVVSTNVGSGRWATFGSNAYYRGNQWNLINTGQPGVCLKMTATGGGTDREFAFCRMEATTGTPSATDLVKMGRDGIVVHSGKRVATAGEFLYMIRGTVNSNGTRRNGGGFTCYKISGYNGRYSVDFSPMFSDIPSVAASVVCDTCSKVDNAMVIRIDKHYMHVMTGDSNASASDRPFSFVVIGQRN